MVFQFETPDGKSNLECGTGTQPASFTICLCISPDSDGDRVPCLGNIDPDETHKGSRNPNAKAAALQAQPRFQGGGNMFHDMFAYWSGLGRVQGRICHQPRQYFMNKLL